MMAAGSRGLFQGQGQQQPQGLSQQALNQQAALLQARVMQQQQQAQQQQRSPAAAAYQANQVQALQQAQSAQQLAGMLLRLQVLSLSTPSTSYVTFHSSLGHSCFQTLIQQSISKLFWVRV